MLTVIALAIDVGIMRSRIVAISVGIFITVKNNFSRVALFYFFHQFSHTSHLLPLNLATINLDRYYLAYHLCQLQHNQ